MGASTSAIGLVCHVIERQDTVDVNDRVLGTVTIQVQLLWATAKSHPTFKLDVRDGELEDLA